MKTTVQCFKALSDETRLRILALLLNSGELCVCHLTAALQLPQSTVSRHLSYLKNAGWLVDRREGVWMYYTIAADEGLKSALAELLRTELPRLPAMVVDLKRLAISMKEFAGE